MTQADQEKWDRLHADRHHAEEPSGFLRFIVQQESWPALPGTALDIACGRGRNALFLAERGWAVEAIDISDVALQETKRRAEAKGLSVSVRQADLNHCELAEAAYDLVINFDFLQRSLIGKIKKALKVGGYVIFETFLIDQQALGHPKNPEYLLRHNELLDWFRDFRVLYYREGIFSEGEKKSYRAGLFAQRQI